jgi:hypothetical protein
MHVVGNMDVRETLRLDVVLDQSVRAHMTSMSVTTPEQIWKTVGQSIVMFGIYLRCNFDIGIVNLASTEEFRLLI